MTQKMEWNEAHIAQMQKLMAEGLSTARIADELVKVFHVECSRNSVIGKIHRLGLSTRQEPIEKKSRPAGVPKQIRRYRLALIVSRPSRPLPPKPRAIEFVALHPITMLEIDKDHCHWIIYDAMMCGDPISPGSSYCPYHRDIGTVHVRVGTR